MALLLPTNVIPTHAALSWLDLGFTPTNIVSLANWLVIRLDLAVRWDVDAFASTLRIMFLSLSFSFIIITLALPGPLTEALSEWQGGQMQKDLLVRCQTFKGNIKRLWTCRGRRQI